MLPNFKLERLLSICFILLLLLLSERYWQSSCGISRRIQYRRLGLSMFFYSPTRKAMKLTIKHLQNKYKERNRVYCLKNQFESKSILGLQIIYIFISRSTSFFMFGKKWTKPVMNPLQIHSILLCIV